MDKNKFIEKFMGGSVTNVPRFWAAMRKHPSYADHPGTKRPDYGEKMPPLEIHFDGVPVTAVARKSSQPAVSYSMRPTSHHTGSTNAQVHPVQNKYGSSIICQSYTYPHTYI